MRKKYFPLLSILSTLTILIFTATGSFAQDAKAVELRTQGYKFQKEGKLKEAVEKYKEAINADRGYATPHNDLGVIYEMQGRLSAAENAYLQALQVNPNYTGVYSNLALLYEKQGDKRRALAYWQKRAQIGNTGDEWTKKAQANADRLIKELSSEWSVSTSSVISTSNFSEKSAQIETMVSSIDLDRKRNKSFAPRKSSSAKKEVRRLVSSARRDLYKERYQDAINKLNEAQSLAGEKTPYIDDLLDEVRSQEIEYELARAAANADLYKKQKLIEVEKAWYPPKPEVVEEASAQQFADSMKSEARLGLERKAKQVIPSIDFNDAQLKEVVEFLAVSNEINIVIDETVVPHNETVTVHLKNIPLNEALDIILRTKGLKYRFEENIVWITTEEKLLEEDLEVRVYDVQDLVGKLFDFPSQPFDFKANLEAAEGEE